MGKPEQAPLYYTGFYSTAFPVAFLFNGRSLFQCVSSASARWQLGGILPLEERRGLVFALVYTLPLVVRGVFSSQLSAISTAMIEADSSPPCCEGGGRIARRNRTTDTTALHLGHVDHLVRLNVGQSNKKCTRLDLYILL
jgi:hypothetical protein